MTTAARQVVLFIAALVALLATLATTAAHAGEPARVTVVDPFVELHSGAGRGYPVLEIVEHGSEVTVIERRTTWYRLRTVRGTEGWAPRAQMLRTLTPAGEAFREQEATVEDFHAHRVEVGALLGDFEGSSSLGVYGAWRFTPNLTTELSVQQAIGRAADSLVVDVSLAGHPLPEAPVSPYFGIGTGIVQTRPATVLVAANRREDPSLSVVLGAERWVSQTFVLRLEYRQYRLLTGREEHEKLDTWKAGLAVFFLIAALAASPLATSLPAHADEAVDPLDPASEAPLIDPEVARREVKDVKIDTENIELGVYAGVLSIEDFGSAPAVGGMLAWHFTEDLFLQAHVYQSEAGLTSYEVLSGSARLLTDNERKYTAYDLSVGYNLFPGEAFVGRKRAFNTAFYVLAGIGSTKFAGDDRFTLNLGAGYRLLPTDWLAWHIGFRDHVFASDVTGEDKQTHNLEFQTGLTTFF